MKLIYYFNVVDNVTGIVVSTEKVWARYRNKSEDVQWYAKKFVNPRPDVWHVELVKVVAI